MMKLLKKLGHIFPYIAPYCLQIDLGIRRELDVLLEKQFANFVKWRFSILSDFLMKIVVSEYPNLVTNFHFQV